MQIIINLVKKKIIAQNLQKKRLNPLVRLRLNMSTCVNKLLTKFKTNKAKKLVELVGLSLRGLKTYIELQFNPGMTWDTYGQWHICSICPLSQALNEQELYKLWNYMNLRPMWATQNIAKILRNQTTLCKIVGIYVKNFYKGTGMSNLKDKLNTIKEQCFQIKIEVLQDGRIPLKANHDDSGFDLFATSDVIIYPGQVQKHPLNIKLEFPRGAWGTITGKSGLGAKGLLVYSGIIDSSYRGIPHVVMSNVNIISHIDEDGYPIMRTQPIIVKKGEKLAQLIMTPYNNEYYFTQVEKVESDTSRGEGGFGSTGA
jgi:deoxyuridine 5'-triphosphate nucleotidohydrolase